MIPLTVAQQKHCPPPLHATVWLFDLDNTLHHADAGIFYIINRAMTAYLADALQLSIQAASDLRQDYWHRYGATLAGLQQHHPHIDIGHFLQASHPLAEILPALKPMAHLQSALAGLPGRKAVFSNGPSFYVQALIEQLGIGRHFEALFGTDDVGLHYKPATAAYLKVCARLRTEPAHCIMVDDSAENLRTAKALGMRTVWFGAQAHPLPFVDLAAADLPTLQQQQAAVLAPD